MEYNTGTEKAEASSNVEEKNIFELPQGLFGFPDLKRMEVVFDQDELPFMWLREPVPEGMAFVVMEPKGIIPDYIIEISDADVDTLGLTKEDTPLILNIVTIGGDDPSAITVNLVGPVVVNRRTGLGKQIIINNHEQYSARYCLADAIGGDESQGGKAAAC